MRQLLRRSAHVNSWSWDVFCSPARGVTAPASTGRSRPSNGRSSCTAPPLYVRRQIVHNAHVVRTLEAKGAIFVEENDEVPEGATVIFSAHGVAPTVHARPRLARCAPSTRPARWSRRCTSRRGGSTPTTTTSCSSATRVTRRSSGRPGQAPERIHLVDGPAEAATVEVRDPNKVAYLSQTTLSVDETQETVRALQKRFPLLQGPPSDDICYATQNRQWAVKAIADRTQLVLVVGSRNSSNSVRLTEVARDAGAAASYLVDGPERHRRGLARGRRDRRRHQRRVGPGGAGQLPCWTWLAEHGFADIEEVTSADEHLQFALPPELRRDMRARGRRPDPRPRASLSRAGGRRSASADVRRPGGCPAGVAVAAGRRGSGPDVGRPSPRGPAPPAITAARPATRQQQDRRAEHQHAGRGGQMLLEPGAGAELRRARLVAEADRRVGDAGP